MKRLFVYVLAICLALSLLSVLSGCGRTEETAPAASPEETPVEAPPAEEPAEEPAAEEPAGIAHGGTGFASYPADTVVARLGDDEVTWEEYYYWLREYTDYIRQVAAQYGFVLDGWYAYDLSPDMTNEGLVLSHAQTTITQNHAARAHIAELGGALTDAEEAEIEDIYDQNADMVTGNSDGETTDEERTLFEDYLEKQMQVSGAFFNSLNRDMYLSQKGFELLYGAGGAELSDEEVLAFAGESGLMSAKHILLLTVDPETREPLSDEECAEKRALAEELYAQLAEAADDPEALDALFDELAAAYTEDDGYAMYPDGYVFGEGEMVSAFENAVKELEIGGLSGIVESEYGYHIILRTAIEPDAVIGTDANGNPTTLRYAAAAQAYSDQLLTWTDEAEVEWEPGFEDPDLLEIFG